MASKTPQEQREELLKKKQQLENRLKALDARQTAQERKDDTRRKILAGAIVLHHATLKPDFQKWLAGELNRSLDKPHDRALFADWLAEFTPAKSEATSPVENQEAELESETLPEDAAPVGTLDVPRTAP